MATETDKIVQELFAKVQEKKKEVAKAQEKPNWKTNCSFSYKKEASPHERINLQTQTEVEGLIDILAFLLDKEESYERACTALGINSTFKWIGFTAGDWKNDIQTRIEKIQVNKKTEELKSLETRLNALVSPELKAQLELEEITKLLA